MEILRLPYDINENVAVAVSSVACHLDAEMALDALSTEYDRAIQTDPEPHVVELHADNVEFPILHNWKTRVPEANYELGRGRVMWHLENEDYIAFGMLEFWYPEAIRLCGVRVEIIPKILFRHPELLTGTKDQESLGSILLRKFGKLAEGFPTQHSAFGFHPGSVPLSAISFFMGGIDDIDAGAIVAFTDHVFADGCGEAAMRAATEEACRVRGIHL
ncbi:hypothetical protein [Paraburkholderia sp. GAS334]|uniref:hypothetical protein n=1 Tax=Paraburkholderia sp. GAS334 TaxID=3035131 RepID=UPI003D26111C